MTMIYLFVSLLTIGLIAIVFLEKDSFGKLPEADRLERIQKSPHYKDGSFQNRIHTPVMAEDASYFKMMREFLFNKNQRYPEKPLTAIKTDLKTLSTQETTIIWFGHSSYLIRVNGKLLLIDPVFSERASPVQSIGSKRFATDHLYTTDDIPPVDAILLTHDHYDHLDHQTILALARKTKHFYTPLGVGEHLEHWGVDSNMITELDWCQETYIDESLKLTCTPARHFSGRGLKRNQTLWCSYVLASPTEKLFLGGDSGYDQTFTEIGNKFGPFDLAILEAGQYDPKWPNIHMAPEETVQAAQDLKTNMMLPVHWGKFSLAMHTWTDPIERVIAAARQKQVSVTTPQIGEPVVLNKKYPNSQWWQ